MTNLTINLGINIVGLKELEETIRAWPEDKPDPQVQVVVGPYEHGKIDVLVGVADCDG